jgi:hypothetical protein
MKAISEEDIGCCGSVCGTCKVKKEKVCIGCKTGYKTNERDLHKAKCKIKICCISKNIETCADCKHHTTCDNLINFYSKNGYKYKKYKEAIDYICKYGYLRFIAQTKKWTMQYGKYE